MGMTTLDIQIQGPVARVYLNRPEVRNAFNDGVIAELTETFTRLGADPALRVIVLGGHGKAFCAGADLNWMRAMAGYSWEQNRADAQALADMLWTLYSCPLPVVGRVHGDCYAGGVGLAAVCDVLVAAEGVNFCLSEARLGLLPATIGPYVVRALGEQASRRYFTTAERFDAGTGGTTRFRARGACRPTSWMPPSTAWSPRWWPTARQRSRPASAWCRTWPGARSTADLRAETARRIADIRASDEGREGVACLPQQAGSRMEAVPELRHRRNSCRHRRRAGLGQRHAPVRRGLPHRRSPATWAGSRCRRACSCCSTRWCWGQRLPALRWSSSPTRCPGVDTPVGCAAHLHPRARRCCAGGAVFGGDQPPGPWWRR
jgi:methylglutaconyl-CoA hydratase